MIRDEFSREKSRQKRYRLRHRRDGLCIACSEQAVVKGYCAKHAIYYRERMRKLNGATRRNLRSKSYRLDDHAV